MSDPTTRPELAPAQPPPPGRLDLNLLPARHRPRPISIPGLLTWLLLASLLAMLVPAWQWFDQQATRYQATVGEAEQLALALQAGAPGDDLDAMATEAAEIDARAAELEAALAGLGLRQFSWSQVLPQILAHTPEGIVFSEILDEGDIVRLDGMSTDERLPLELVEALTALNLFESVRLETLDRLDVDLSTPTPTATPRPRTTPTPAPEVTPAPVARFHFVLSLILRAESQP